MMTSTTTSTIKKKLAWHTVVWQQLKPVCIGLLIVVCLDVGISASSVSLWLDEQVENPIDLKYERLADFNQSYASQFLRKKATPHAAVTLKQNVKGAPKKVWFIGSSRTHNGFIPSIFNQQMANADVETKAFNFGLPSSDHVFYRYLLPDLINTFGKPDLLLIETADFMALPYFSANPLYYYKWLSHNPQHWQSFLSDTTLPKSLRLKTLLSISSLYRYNRALSPVTLLKKWIDPTTKGTQKEGCVGFDGWQPLQVAPTIYNPNLWALDYYKQNAHIAPQRLKTLLNWTQSEHINTVLVEWPDHPEYKRQAQTIDAYKNYTQMVSEFSQSENIAVIQMPSIESNIQADPYYADLRHTNHNGAAFITKRLAKIMTSRSEVIKKLDSD